MGHQGTPPPSQASPHILTHIHTYITDHEVPRRSDDGDSPNFRGIIACKSHLDRLQMDLSQFFDYAVDEEAVDALVYLGGNPSVSEGKIFGSGDCSTLCRRNITRRLYHGAKGLDMHDLKDALYWTENNRGFQASGRRAYYLKVEIQKFSFWFKHKPSLLSTEATQDYPIEGGPVICGGGPGFTCCRPKLV